MENNGYNPPLTSNNVNNENNENIENNDGNKDIVNQDKEIQDRIDNLYKALKSKPKFVYCPYCNKGAITKVEQSCSVTAGFLCVLGLGVFWLACQACRDKDYNCTDTTHYCGGGCTNKLADYHAA